MSGRDLSGPIRRAVIDKLKAAPGITALVGAKVYDYVSASHAFPYIRCTTTITTPWEVSGNVRGSLILVQVDAFARGYGKEAVDPINAAIVAALDEQGLALDEGYPLYIQWQQTQTLDDPSEQGVYHGVIEFETVAAE